MAGPADAAKATGAANIWPTAPDERRIWWESIAAIVREQMADVRKVAT
ncbi:hypothetical protein [Mycolicibacterium phlei]|jgi:hypothetical protein|nr:hypothetical protein [Mycolicibacterium phlei]